MAAEAVGRKTTTTRRGNHRSSRAGPLGLACCSLDSRGYSWPAGGSTTLTKTTTRARSSPGRRGWGVAPAESSSGRDRDREKDEGSGCRDRVGDAVAGGDSVGEKKDEENVEDGWLRSCLRRIGLTCWMCGEAWGSSGLR